MADSPRPVHPLFGAAGKNELAAAALKMRSQGESKPPAAAPDAASPPNSSAASAPKAFRPPSQAGGNAMAEQVAMLAQRRQERMNAEGIVEVEPAPRPPQETKPPVFTQAKLRQTEQPTRDAVEDAEDPAAVAYSQGRLKTGAGAVDPRAAPEQEAYERKDEEAPVPTESALPSEPEMTEYYPENPQYERVLLSRQEPQVVTEHRVMKTDPEYEIIEYKVCCAIL